MEIPQPEGKEATRSRRKWIIGCCVSAGLFLLLVLNYLYGATLYASLTGQEDQYRIGELCSKSLLECEDQYFKSDLDAISTISNASRDYFANFYIVADSQYYTGNCPCPYDTDTRGYSCGGRSSYSKGGKISYCYSSDISDVQIADKKQSLLNDANKTLDTDVQHSIGIYKEKVTLFAILILFATVLFYYKKDLFESIK